MLTNRIAVIISQCTRVANHHVLHLNLHSVTCHLYLSKARNIINISSTASKVKLFYSWLLLVCRHTVLDFDLVSSILKKNLV